MDMDDNGDLEYSEFKMALKKQNVSLSDDQITELFNFINVSETGFIDGIEWITFMLQRFQSPLLNGYQTAILDQVNNIFELMITQQPFIIISICKTTYNCIQFYLFE